MTVIFDNHRADLISRRAQGYLALGSPMATYGSGDSCFATPLAAGVPATPSYGGEAAPQQLLSMPLPELDFSPDRLFAPAAERPNHHEVTQCTNPRSATLTPSKY